jgi:hypothetical protein
VRIRAFTHLEVDNDDEHEHSGQQVENVGQVRTVECFLQCLHFVTARDEQMEQSNDGSFELSSAASVDGGRGESLPDDVLADVGGDEERNSRAQSITLLQKLILHKRSAEQKTSSTRR